MGCGIIQPVYFCLTPDDEPGWNPSGRGPRVGSRHPPMGSCFQARDAVEHDVLDAAIDTIRIFDTDNVGGFSKAVGETESRPISGDAGVDLQHIANPGDAQDGFEAQAVHPACRAGVPRPASASGMRGEAVDIGGDDIRFHLVAARFFRRIGMVDGI